MIPDGRRPWRPFRTLLGTHCRRYLLYSACPSLPSDFIVLHAQATHSLRGEPGKKNMGFQRVHLVLLPKLAPLAFRLSAIRPFPQFPPFPIRLTWPIWRRVFLYDATCLCMERREAKSAGVPSALRICKVDSSSPRGSPSIAPYNFAVSRIFRSQF